jgi:hypothetical protein
MRITIILRLSARRTVTLTLFLLTSFPLQPILYFPLTNMSPNQSLVGPFFLIYFTGPSVEPLDPLPFPIPSYYFFLFTFVYLYFIFSLFFSVTHLPSTCASFLTLICVLVNAGCYYCVFLLIRSQPRSQSSHPYICTTFFHILLTLFPWRWSKLILPKLWYLSSKPHDVTPS